MAKGHIAASFVKDEVRDQLVLGQLRFPAQRVCPIYALGGIGPIPAA